MTEVRPEPDNKVWLQNDQIRINYIQNNREAHDRLVYRWIDTLKAVEADPSTKAVLKAPTHARGEAPLSVVGFACGTCRMGNDPSSSVVNRHGQCHELDNLISQTPGFFQAVRAAGLG